MSAPLRSLCMKGYENRVFTALQTMREAQAKKAAELHAAAQKAVQANRSTPSHTADRFEKQNAAKANPSPTARKQ